ncbi:MAG: sigma-70 family RNA polymerase sigma factor [Planctomycetota bacterium]|nr:sigma-70 family RNA polymerase sigma factor [Planctomycetota bacterium]
MHDAGTDLDAALRPFFREAREGVVDVEGIFALIGRELYHYSFALCGSRSQTEDAIQDLVVKLLEQGERLREVRQPRGWLYTVVRRLACPRKRPSPEQCARRFAESVEADPSERLELQEALARLRPLDQELILLHVWQEMTFTEIAEVLALPRGTALSAYHRALQKLRASLDGPPLRVTGFPLRSKLRHAPAT